MMIWRIEPMKVLEANALGHGEWTINVCVFINVRDAVVKLRASITLPPRCPKVLKSNIGDSMVSIV